MQHQHQQQQQQLAGGQAVQPSSAPLMSFGPSPGQQQQPAMGGGSLPQALQGVLQQPGLPYAHAATSHGGLQPGQPAQQVLQFGAIQLPTAIDGSVEAEVLPPAGASLSPAEAQHAYMSRKAAERAQHLQQQQQQQQQQHGVSLGPSKVQYSVLHA
jgi:hypothetical protein